MPPPPRRALDHHRIADALRFCIRVLDIADEARARRQGYAGSLRQFARFVLQAEGTHVLRFRPDEDDPGVFARLREVGIFRQKAVAWVDSLRPRLLRGVKDDVVFQIAFRRGRGADGNGFSRLADVHRMAIGFRIDGDAGDSHPVEGPDDAASDGAAICDQDFPKHVRYAPFAR